MPITFDVDPTKTPQELPRPTSIFEHVSPDINKHNGRLVKVSNSSERYLKSRFSNGFVGACIYAYNLHLHLVLSPDAVWIAITTSLSRFINANAEKLRGKFVEHEGQLELKAVSMGDLSTANYQELFSQIADAIDERTKGDIRSLIECDFSTTTPHTRLVSKFVLMAGMKQYFKYQLGLMCGLPKVTLTGTIEDWKAVQARARRLSEFEDPTLVEWSKVLSYVLEYFVSAFLKPVDRDFWNRVAHYTGGGSGPRYLEGWVLAFVGFDENGKYILNSVPKIKSTHKFGRMDTENVPTATVDVPVKINDNGIEYNSVFYAGPMLPAMVDETSITPALDWAFAVLNAKEGEQEAPLPVTPYAGAQIWDDHFVDEREMRGGYYKKKKKARCVLS